MESLRAMLCNTAESATTPEEDETESIAEEVAWILGMFHQRCESRKFTFWDNRLSEQRFCQVKITQSIIHCPKSAWLAKLNSYQREGIEIYSGVF